MATSVASMALVADGRKSFTWSTVCDRYKNRPAEQHSLNLFHFAYHHWSANKTTTPHIFGYYDVATWPLKEDYLCKVHSCYLQALEKFPRVQQTL